MDWFLNNWYYIVFFVGVILLCIYGCMTGKVKEWLKYAVVEAEKYLGTGTGQLKLRAVYDMFVQAYPVFSKILPFSFFSKMVDDALEWMNQQLSKNVKIDMYVNNKEVNECQ